jgi:cytoskeletal protein RodZ
MKSSIFLTGLGAALAVAGPVRIEKRLITTDVVVEWVTVTVTDVEQETESASRTLRHHFSPGAHSYPPAKVTTTSVAEVVTPTVEPTTSTVEPEPTTTTTTEEAVATTSEAVITMQAEAVTTTSAVATQAVASTTAAAAAAAPTDFISTSLYNHNVHRFNNSVGAVTWGQTYADSALVLAKTCKWGHNV